MRAAPTIAQMFRVVSADAVAGASAAGSGWLPNSELLSWPLPPLEAPAAPAGAGLGVPPVSGAVASVLLVLVSVLLVSVAPVPEPLVSVLVPPELSVPLPPEVPEPEVSVVVPLLSGPGWKSELEAGAGAWPGQVDTLGSQ
jgi:hypothetical protein